MKYNSESETRKHIARVGYYIHNLISNLLNRADEHDKSKLEDPEKEIFDKFTPKLAKSTYGSDKYKKFLDEMKPALDHHYSKNSHHPEYYLNHHPMGNVSGLHDMDLLDIIEMLCDWKAATERHEDGNIFKSLDINQKRFGYTDELKSILLNTIKYLV